MALIVTGGAGFVGSHMVDILVQEGYEIYIIDNLFSGKLENLPQPLPNNVTFVKKDLRKIEQNDPMFKDVEAIFHIAAQASVSFSVREIYEDLSINVTGSIKLFQAAVHHDVENLIYISSGGAIYGDVDTFPTNEEAPTNPVSPYGISKLTGEKYLQYFAHDYGLKYTIIRPSNIYGPRQSPDGEAGVISIFLNQLKKSEPLHIFGDGNNTRDYIYVKDIADLCYKAFKRPTNEAYNAGTGIETSVNQLVKIIEKVTRLKAQVVYDPPRPGDARRSVLDCSKAKKRLNWEPKVQLKEGIQYVWEWIKQQS